VSDWHEIYKLHLADKTPVTYNYDSSCVRVVDCADLVAGIDSATYRPIEMDNRCETILVEINTEVRHGEVLVKRDFGRIAQAIREYCDKTSMMSLLNKAGVPMKGHGNERNSAQGCPLPGCDSRHDAFRIHLDRDPDSDGPMFACRRCGRGGDTVRLALYLQGIDPTEKGATARFLAEEGYLDSEVQPTEAESPEVFSRSFIVECLGRSPTAEESDELKSYFGQYSDMEPDHARYMSLAQLCWRLGLKEGRDKAHNRALAYSLATNNE
jgi:hypothetical protein